jgi:ABC-type maltose transport system permease subunit
MKKEITFPLYIQFCLNNVKISLLEPISKKLIIKLAKNPLANVFFPCRVSNIVLYLILQPFSTALRPL